MATEKLITTFLSSDEAFLFKKFQQHHELIAYFVGYLEAMGLKRIENSQVILDIDQYGIITHSSITKHFRK